MRTCSCGAYLDDDQRFCTECGKEQVSQTQQTQAFASCPHCGQPLAPGQNFCMTCGSSTGSFANAGGYNNGANNGGYNGGNGNNNGGGNKASVALIAGAAVIAALIIGLVLYFFVLSPTNTPGGDTPANHTHSWSSYVAADSPTCTKDGTKVRTCSGCGQTDKVTDPGSALGHKYSNGKCTRCGEADPNKPSGNTVTLSVQSKSAGTLTGTVRRDSNGYVLSDSSSHLYTASEITSLNLSAAELVVARNEIFARHGYDFNNAGLQSYFNGCSWYHNSGTKPALAGGSVEDKNTALLLEYTKDRYPQWVDLVS